MPELPEVEALCRQLDERVRGRVISAVRLRSVAALKTYTPRLDDLVGETLRGCDRHGKFIDLRGDEWHIVLHLARGGWIRWRDEVSEARAVMRGPVALQIVLDDEREIDVSEHGKEKRLAVYAVREASEVPGIARLGIDALDPTLDAARLGALLQGRGEHLKNALADQTLLSGVGNAWSDEILHVARLSPFRRAGSLDPAEVETLHSALRSVLGNAVGRALQTEMTQLKSEKKTALRVHGRAGETCPVCGDVVREVAGSRTFNYCPTCQTGGKVYADRRFSRLGIVR